MIDFDRMYLRPVDVAGELGLTRSAVYKMLREDRLPKVRFGKSVRIPAAAFQAWCRAREAGAWVPTREMGAPDDAAIDEPRSLGQRCAAFRLETGYGVMDYLAAWKRDEIEDTPENSVVAMEAIALREAVRRAGPSAAGLVAETAGTGC